MIADVRLVPRGPDSVGRVTRALGELGWRVADLHGGTADDTPIVRFRHDGYRSHVELDFNLPGPIILILVGEDAEQTAESLRAAMPTHDCADAVAAAVATAPPARLAASMRLLGALRCSDHGAAQVVNDGLRSDLADVRAAAVDAVASDPNPLFAAAMVELYEEEPEDDIAAVAGEVITANGWD